METLKSELALYFSWIILSFLKEEDVGQETKKMYLLEQQIFVETKHASSQCINLEFHYYTNLWTGANGIAIADCYEGVRKTAFFERLSP